MALVQGPAATQEPKQVSQPGRVVVISNGVEIIQSPDEHRVDYHPTPKFTSDEDVQVVNATISEPQPEPERPTVHVDPTNEYKLDAAKAKLIQLLEMKEKLKGIDEQIDQNLENIAKWAGINHMWQENDGTVYKVQESHGRFVKYNRFEVAHTRRKHLYEERGSLSIKDARDAGFEVE